MTYLYLGEGNFAGGWTEKVRLKVCMEAEYFGVGLFNTMAEMYPEHVEPSRACATMEQFNIDYCAPFARAAGIHVSEKRAEHLTNWGVKFARKHDFAHVAKAAVKETPEADKLYSHLAKHGGTPELKTLGEDLVAHENALRAWLQSEMDGKSDGAAQVFAYLERHGITRQQALTPRPST